MGKMIFNLSDADYHKLQDKNHHYSSSQLKDALDDIELFHKKYIIKEIEQEDLAVFDIGKYFHMAILEPNRLTKDTAVWMGDRRVGKAWEEFKVQNEGKIILTARDITEAENLIKAVRDNPIFSGLVTHQMGKSEVSIFQKFMGVNVKVRYDFLVMDGEKNVCYGLDLKSTKGNCKSKFKIQNTVSNYNYDLSSALYVDVLNAHFEEINSPFRVQNYYLGFASKDYCNSQVWRMDEKSLAVGRAKYTKALTEIKNAIKRDWKIDHAVIDLTPAQFELAWLDNGEIKETKHKPSPNVVRATKGSKL